MHTEKYAKMRKLNSPKGLFEPKVARTRENHRHSDRRRSAPEEKSVEVRLRVEIEAEIQIKHMLMSNE